jgi:hypothetical protein
MNSPTLNEISGYKEPTHLISVINDLEEKNEELRREFLRFVEHFKCFEKGSSDPSDAVAFKRAREVLNNS